MRPETKRGSFCEKQDEQTIREIVSLTPEKLNAHQLAQRSSLGFLAVHCCLESENMADIRNQVDSNLSIQDHKELIRDFVNNSEEKLDPSAIASGLNLMPFKVYLYLGHQDMVDISLKVTYEKEKQGSESVAQRREHIRYEIDECGHKYRVDLDYLALLFECHKQTLYVDFRSQELAGYREIMDDKIACFDKNLIRDCIKQTEGRISLPEIARAVKITGGRLDRLLQDDDMVDIIDLIEERNGYRPKKKIRKNSREYTKQRIRDYIASLTEEEKQAATFSSVALELNLTHQLVRRYCQEDNMIMADEVLSRDKILEQSKRRERIRQEIKAGGDDRKVSPTSLASLLKVSQNTIEADLDSEEMAGYRQLMEEKMTAFEERQIRLFVNENEKITATDLARAVGKSLPQIGNILASDNMADVRELMEAKNIAFDKKQIRGYIQAAEGVIVLAKIAKDLKKRPSYPGRLLKDNDMADARALMEAKNTEFEKQFIRDYVETAQEGISLLAIARTMGVRNGRVSQHIQAPDMQETKDLMEAKNIAFDKKRISEAVSVIEGKISSINLAKNIKMRIDRVRSLLEADDMQETRDLIRAKNTEIEKQSIRDYVSQMEEGGINLSTVAQDLQIKKTVISSYLNDEGMGEAREKLVAAIAEFEKQKIRDYVAGAETAIGPSDLVKNLKIKRVSVDQYLKDEDMLETREKLEAMEPQLQKKRFKDYAESREKIQMKVVVRVLKIERDRLEQFLEDDDMADVKAKIIADVSLVGKRKARLRKFVEEHPNPEELTPEIVASQIEVSIKTLGIYARSKGMEDIRHLLYKPKSTEESIAKRREQIRQEIDGDWGEQKVTRKSLAQLTGVSLDTIRKDLAHPEMTGYAELIEQKSFEFDKRRVLNYVNQAGGAVLAKKVTQDLKINKPRLEQLLADDDLAEIRHLVHLKPPSIRKTQDESEDKRPKSGAKERPPLKLTARQQEIKEYMDKESYLTLPKVAKRFDLSLNLARRDIKKIGYQDLLD